jgi:hypothetical protein
MLEELRETVPFPCNRLPSQRVLAVRVVAMPGASMCLKCWVRPATDVAQLPVGTRSGGLARTSDLSDQKHLRHHTAPVDGGAYLSPANVLSCR